MIDKEEKWAWQLAVTFIKTSNPTLYRQKQSVYIQLKDCTQMRLSH